MRVKAIPESLGHPKFRSLSDTEIAMATGGLIATPTYDTKQTTPVGGGPSHDDDVHTDDITSLNA